MSKKPFYVIMMDHHLEEYPRQWAFVHKDDTEEDAMLHGEYEAIIGKLPRDRYIEDVIVRKSLEYTPTGEVKDGAVYKLTPK